MTIFENGYVGINTIGTTAAELTVGGKVHAKEVKILIPQGTAPDYVFANDYDLPTLLELEAYIAQHKHLPNVPKGNVMEENGVELGEMNMILLRKVEELSLYLIEQNKQLEQLKATVQKQQAQLDQITK